jgi:hypothetical protein
MKYRMLNLKTGWKRFGLYPDQGSQYQLKFHDIPDILVLSMGSDFFPDEFNFLNIFLLKITFKK